MKKSRRARKEGGDGGDEAASGHPAAAADGAGSSPEIDLKSRIREHSLFFDRLVELIPSRFYLPAPDDRPWYLGLNKAEKASFRMESRDNLKKARRARFDPETAASTIDIIKKNVEAEKLERLESNPNPESEPTDENAEIVSVDRSVTYEELRDRLRRRIEELQSTRNTRNPDKLREKKVKIKNKSLKNAKKGRSELREGKRKRDEVPGEGGSSQWKKPKGEWRVDDGGQKDLTFGAVKLGGDSARMKKRKFSKVQELEMAKRLEEAKKDPEKGEMVSKKHQWKAAVSRASGVKVHDDPKLLKESIKKEKKRHEKHAKKWKERVESRDKVREDKQRKRSENIKEKIHKNKMKKIEKREKKLMRPGFEGRKDGYING